jgi:TRAP transporter TAXI family solute receptor
MQPGTLNHTTGTAIAKVAKEKAGLNALVQPTAGESVIIPLVGRSEAEFGIANALEVSVAVENNRLPELRLIGAIHPLPTAFFVRKDTTMRTIADLKGRKVVFGFSAQRTLDQLSRAILATGGLTERDINPVLVPNVIRGADDFVAGAADTFYFAFGAPKVREVDATVGGIRALEVPEAGMPEARKVYPDGYLAPAAPGPFYIGVEKPMGVYTWDNLLFTNAKVKDDVVYKMIEAMAKNKDDLIAVQPALRAFTPPGLYKKFSTPYHPGALKYFADNKIEIKTAQ